MNGYNILLLDNDGNITDSNNIGEIFIGGAGVAKGYVNDLIITEKAFIKYNNERFYKTGDLAYWHDEELIFIGRKDSQIQINGIRVEIDEIIKKYIEYWAN